MPQRRSTGYRNPTSSRWLTTLLAGGWGLSSAYIFFNSLLISHDARPCIVSFIPLVIVWATLERKRWGRLAMIGLSATSVGLFLAALGWVFAKQDVLLPTQRNLAHCAQTVLKMYCGAPTVTYVLLGLALTTGIWMRLPAVVAEFERGKRVTLARAQGAIAFSLVTCWAAMVILTSPSIKATGVTIPTSTRHSQGKTASPKPTHNKRASLVEAADMSA